jgi:hypothetical protein
MTILELIDSRERGYKYEIAALKAEVEELRNLLYEAQMESIQRGWNLMGEIVVGALTVVRDSDKGDTA